MAELSISNVVGGGSLGKELDLRSIAETQFNHFDTQYDPESFSAVVFRCKICGPTIMLYRSGKFSIAGAKSVEQTREGFDVFCSDIQNKTGLGINPNLEIRYFVTTGDLGRSINLSAATIALGVDRTEYEPEQFPGLFYRPESEDWFIILFSSGSVVVDGIPDMDMLESAYKKVDDMLSNNGI
jgi:transcription initiation factor TFIID TATA-box-binding protein